MDFVSSNFLQNPYFNTLYYHNKAESKNGFEKILTFTLNWGAKILYVLFFLSFKTLGYLFALILAKIGSFDIYKHSKVILQA